MTGLAPGQLPAAPPYNADSAFLQGMSAADGCSPAWGRFSAAVGMGERGMIWA